MSPLFKDMFDESHEESEIITLDFADEKNFAKVIEFCDKAEYEVDRSEEVKNRRLLARQDVRQIEEIFVENAQDEQKRDERWKVKFFKALALEEVVQLANLANYLNIPALIDACLEVIAISLRRSTDRATQYDP